MPLPDPALVYSLGPLSERDYATLLWLKDRGYDGDAHAQADAIEEGKNGELTLRFTEPSAWAVNEYIESDPDAFLSCNGSDSLYAAFRLFLDAIV